MTVTEQICSITQIADVSRLRPIHVWFRQVQNLIVSSFADHVPDWTSEKSIANPDVCIHGVCFEMNGIQVVRAC